MISYMICFAAMTIMIGASYWFLCRPLRERMSTLEKVFAAHELRSRFNHRIQRQEIRALKALSGVESEARVFATEIAAVQAQSNSMREQAEKVAREAQKAEQEQRARAEKAETELVELRAAIKASVEAGEKVRKLIVQEPKTERKPFDPSKQPIWNPVEPFTYFKF